MGIQIKQEQGGERQYRDQKVTQGFLKIPGVDYIKSLLPVAPNMSSKQHFSKQNAKGKIH